MFIYGELYEMKQLGKRAKGGKDLWRNLIISEREQGRIWTYNHNSGKLTPGCERSVIKIPPKMYTEVRGYPVYFICRTLTALLFSKLWRESLQYVVIGYPSAVM